MKKKKSNFLQKCSMALIFISTESRIIDQFKNIYFLIINLPKLSKIEVFVVVIDFFKKIVVFMATGVLDDVYLGDIY